MPPEITPVSYSVPVIFRSARGRVVLHRLALTAADTPETILLKLQVLYKTHVKLSRRLFHRIALVQKPVVELAGFGMVRTVFQRSLCSVQNGNTRLSTHISLSKITDFL